MSQSKSILALSIVAATAITAQQFVTAGGAVASAAGNALGVARSDAASGALVPVDVLGTAVATAGAAITAGAHVEIGTAGKVVTLASGKAVGVALEAAGADGDPVEIFLIPN